MSRVSRTARRTVFRAVAALPESLRVTLHPTGMGYRLRDIPAPPVAPDGEVRLLIAPANYAAQGYWWARAAERLPGVGAMNVQWRETDDPFAFPADHEVPLAVMRGSESWAKRFFDAVAGGFTHVLVEAVSPLFGRLFDGDVEAEVAALRAAGVQVGMIVHGTDVRVPSVHRATSPWSVYHDADPEWVEARERGAVARRGVLERIDAPIFASTTTLAGTVPGATWLPVTIRPDHWPADTDTLRRDVPVVVHAPSSSAMKGTELVRASVAPLVADGLIDYREYSGIAAAEMPGLYGSADIVIDAVRMGNYGVAACEAMASGRVVVVHLSTLAMEDALARGIAPPVFETDPPRLEQTLRDILADRDAARSLAHQGPGFVDEIHSGRRAARVLAPFLGVDMRNWRVGPPDETSNASPARRHL